MPKSWKITRPAAAKTTRVTKIAIAARLAIQSFLSRGTSPVIETKIGTAAIGSTTRNRAEKESTAKRRSSPVIVVPLSRVG